MISVNIFLFQCDVYFAILVTKLSSDALMPKNVLNSNQTLDRIAKNYAIFAGTAGAVFVIFPALHTIVIYFMNQRKEVEIRKYVTSSVHE